MPRIFSYRKVTDKFTTHCLREPDGLGDEMRITELCTINDRTYVAVPDFMELPEQPEAIATTLKEEGVLTDELVREIKKRSTHIKLINQRVVEMIRKRFSLDDELKMLRRSAKDPDAFKAYDEYVEKCIAWGKGKKAELGLR
ncbi:MAG: hypothetical protein JRI96_07850 [Deltaproteobacteria bacterium]|nr:hypothetical protein [Deltaproteobacteria bacterium]